MAGTVQDDDWKPPSAADMKIIEARQERSNQISKLMGEYMLKGFRMLDKICHCSTILLQDRNGVDYCVACNELESECAKDDPVLSSEAARVAVLEGSTQSTQHQIDRLNFYESAPSERASVAQVKQQAHGDGLNAPESMDAASLIPPTSVADIVKSQIELAAHELQNTGSIEMKIQLCTLIKAASEALSALHRCERN